MEAVYHRAVLAEAVGGQVSPRALAAMSAANVGQDSLRGLLHFAWHFDNSLFAEGLADMEQWRAEAAPAADPATAWAAFGRLSHAAQDFYSHSNSVALWRARFAGQAAPPVDSIDGLDGALLKEPRLKSGRVYLPWEALALVAALRPLAKRLLPRDAHAWMNLDRPDTGPLFAYSLVAARQRTRAEFDRTLAAIGEAQGEAAMRAFRDL
ncbi:MAG: hypothetical protein IT317_23700 [Anaerolineales bacterium]|nr:hypothetical protein [Anaerolineales bacterium]